MSAEDPELAAAAVIGVVIEPSLRTLNPLRGPRLSVRTQIRGVRAVDTCGPHATPPPTTILRALVECRWRIRLIGGGGGGGGWTDFIMTDDLGSGNAPESINHRPPSSSRDRQAVRCNRTCAVNTHAPAATLAG